MSQAEPINPAAFASFDAFYAALFALYQAKDYARALDLATEAVAHFPDHLPLLYHFRACMASCAGSTDLALDLLNESVAAGYWYPEPYWDDADFTPIKESPEFQRLRALSGERQAVAQAGVKPVLLVEPPESGLAAEPAPLVMALHGNTHNATSEASTWRAALDDRWLLALPQATMIVGTDMFVWNDRDQSEQDLADYYATMVENYPVDRDRVVLAGFSMGAETAIYLALKGSLPVRGFVAVAPGGPFTQEPEQWKPWIAAAQARGGVRGVIIMGGQDVASEQTRVLAAMLNEAGIPCDLRDYPDMGHDFPPDFNTVMAEAVAFVLGD